MATAATALVLLTVITSEPAEPQQLWMDQFHTCQRIATILADADGILSWRCDDMRTGERDSWRRPPPAPERRMFEWMPWSDR